VKNPEKRIRLTCEAGAPRLDTFLHENIADLSRARLQALIREGCVQLAGKMARKVSQRISPGARVEVRLPPPEPHYLKPENIPLDIRFEDEHLLVVNKPPGMVVHPGAGRHEGTLVGALLYHCRGQLSGIGGVERPGIVHRLDKDTSGLLLVAKADLVHQRLSEALKAHDIRRRYMALVKGVPALGIGAIDAPIGRHPTHRTAMAVVKKNGRDAVTRYKVQEVLEGAAFLLVRLETGRTHQIRVHLNHIGHPVIGDPLYGGGRLPRPGNRVHDVRFDSLIQRQALHAYRLGFKHPMSGESMKYEAEPPEDFLDALEKLRARTSEANPPRP
jgi:23S rRNA pseudouridine1911/1915/1917 synthase